MKDTVQERFNLEANDKVHLDKLMSSMGLTSNEYFRICVKQALIHHGVPFRLKSNS